MSDCTATRSELAQAMRRPLPGPPALVQLDPFRIKDGGPSTRLEDDEAADRALLQSIAAHGQRVPVLVCPHPDQTDTYQIIAGRRRVLAARDLGQPVLAIISPLDDVGTVLAQGQDNILRRDLSFIEKADFARQLAEAGYSRKVIGQALSVNKTLVSRMLAVTQTIPVAVIWAIGAAPSIGRERWSKLTRVFVERAADIDIDTVVGFAGCVGTTSDARFEGVLAMLERAPKLEAAARARPRPLQGAEGLAIGTVSRTRRRVTLSFRPRAARGFEEWLVANVAELHREWLARQTG
ncbi:plasmid partitioning protein RepB [Gymnodinialimonas sp. 2305UL16-5]|uniref:plasmid partitioning protein RepB n=1 Tax=Gymnodinialimonas mytili TaxID=3126503 RepID=UPI0030B5906B